MLVLGSNILARRAYPFGLRFIAGTTRLLLCRRYPQQMLIEVEEGGGAELKENGIRKEMVREEWEANALIIVKTSKNKLEDMQCEVKVHVTPTFRLSHAYTLFLV